MSIALYGFWRSAATFRVRVALNLKGLAAHEIPVDLDGGAQHAAEFRAINPQGAVPALVEDGLPPLTQSLAILEYLEERTPEPPLLPHGLRDRARVRAIAASIACDSHPLIVPRVRSYLFEKENFDPARWKEWQTEWFGAGLRTVESLLDNPATGRFCHGDAPGMADICLVSCMIGVKVFKLELGPLPIVQRVTEECRKLEAFAAAMPDRQADFPKA